VGHIDSDDCEGLIAGKCYIFPKMDGGNASVYVEDGGIRCATRNQPVDSNNPIYKHVISQKGIVDLLTDHPEVRLYGEWMVPHTVKTYTNDVWNRLFVFDVCVDGKIFDDVGSGVHDEGHFHLPYDVYAPVLERYGVNYIKPLEVIDFPTFDRLHEIADKANDAYIMPNLGCGEGIVIKRYDFVNQRGETVWGKVLNSVFTQNRISRLSFDPSGASVEQRIANRVVTPLLVDKEIHKFEADRGPINPSAALNIVWYCVVTEYMWDEIRRNKEPIIDFKKLKKTVFAKVREIRPELFGAEPEGE